MKYLAVVLVSILPAVGWLLYFHKTDKYEPEPKKLVFRTFGIGVLFAVALGTAYTGLPYPWGPARYSAVIWAPLVEEIGKFLIVYWTVFRNKNFNEPIDGIVYAASAAGGRIGRDCPSCGSRCALSARSVDLGNRQIAS